MDSEVIIIGAMSENRVIGAGDGMPWDVPDEYQRYLDTVRGSAVVMGRRSFDIFADDLKGVATPIAVTSRPVVEGGLAAPSLEEALRLADDVPGPTYVAGGAKLYEQAIPLADVMLLSTIHGEFAGDTHFPAFDADAWRLVRFEKHPGYDFREYRRHGDWGVTRHRTLASRSS